MERKTLALVLLVVIIALGVSIFNDARITQAAEKDSLNDVVVKLDQVIKNQQEMFKRFDAVMEELKIVKVRATR